MKKDEIKKHLRENKIQLLQLDPFGYCNAKCWFCPVRYTPNPPEGVTHMPLELLEKILDGLIEEREKSDGVVGKNFLWIYTAHYNEVLLYKHFEGLLENLRKHRLTTILLSNGTPLTPQKTDLISKYRDVVTSINLNIPAFEAELWEKRTGFKKEKFEALIDNICYAYRILHDMIRSKNFSIRINGVSENNFTEAGGALQPGKNLSPDIDLDAMSGERATQRKIAEGFFPEMYIFEGSLEDRSGLLADQKIIDNSPFIKEHQRERRSVTGCTLNGESGGRLFGTLHVNANGDAFICCHDYNFDLKFGNFREQTLRDVWHSDLHVDRIYESLNSMCKKCIYATWGDCLPP